MTSRRFHEPVELRYISEEKSKSAISALRFYVSLSLHSPKLPEGHRAASATLLSRTALLGGPITSKGRTALQNDGPADYSLTIATTPIELAPNRIISVTTYNGQFPGPLLRLKEGERVSIEIRNDTDTPEQLHWHGQFVSPAVDGAAEEGPPFIPAHGSRRVSFVPKPAGFRFYHTHVRGGANLAAGQYSGLVGPVYIEPTQHAGNYDREVFLTLKEFQPTLSRGGDMPAQTVSTLQDAGESKMKASLAKGMLHGYEVGYDSFTINGSMLDHGEPVRVKAGERVLFHVLNGSATEIRSLALPGHSLDVIAMDGNPLPSRSVAGSVAGNRGTDFSHRGNEPSWGLGNGRPRRR